MRTLLFGLFVGSFFVAMAPLHWTGAEFVMWLCGLLLLHSGLVRLPGAGALIARFVPESDTSATTRFLVGVAIGSAGLIHALDDVVVADSQQLACVGEKRLLRVRVVGLPSSGSEGSRFDGFVLDTPTTVPLCNRLRGQLIRFASAQPLPLQPGQQLVLEASFRPIRGVVSPGAFDIELHALRRGWLVRGRVVRLISIRESSTFAAREWRLSVQAWLDRCRARLRTRLLDSRLDHADVLVALAIGDSSALEPARWRLLQNTGTAHLLVISGLHVGLVGGLLLFLLRPLMGAVIVQLRFLTGEATSGVGLLFLIWSVLVGGYVGLVGAGVPAVRAGLMGMAVLAVWLTRRRLDGAVALLAALAGVYAVQPLAAYEPGFWLSFLLVSWLLLRSIERQPEEGSVGRRWLGRLLLALKFNALCAFVMLPLLVLFGLPVALSAPFANLLAVPLVSLLIVPLVLLGALLGDVAPQMALLLFTMADHSLRGLFGFLVALQTVLPAPPVANVNITAAGLGALLLFACLFSGHTPIRLVFLIGLGGFLLSPPAAERNAGVKVAQGEFGLDFLDVGQGLAVLIRTARHTFLYDTGGSTPGGFNFVDAVVAPGMTAFGRYTLDGLVISHADNDHAGGVSRARTLWAPTVVAGLPEIGPGRGATSASGCVWGSLAPASVAESQFSQLLLIDGVELRLLQHTGAASRNDRSCVLVISSHSAVAVLTGDIGVRTEHALLPELPSDVAIMSVPHHGSLSSSSVVLLEHLSPDIAVVSAGSGNRFGHPKAEVLQRYAQEGVRVVNTAEEGTVSWLSSAPHLIRSARVNRLRRAQLGAPLLQRRRARALEAGAAQPKPLLLSLPKAESSSAAP